MQRCDMQRGTVLVNTCVLPTCDHPEQRQESHSYVVEVGMPCQVLPVFDCTPEGHANDSIDEEEQAQDTDDVSKGCSTQQRQVPTQKESRWTACDDGRSGEGSRGNTTSCIDAVMLHYTEQS